MLGRIRQAVRHTPPIPRCSTSGVTTLTQTRALSLDNSIINDVREILNGVYNPPSPPAQPSADAPPPTSEVTSPTPLKRSSIYIFPPPADPLLSFLTSSIQQDGNRHRASRTISRTLLYIYTMTRCPPLPIVRQAIFSASPSVRLMTQKRGGKSVQKPIALGEKQRTRYAVRWMLQSSNRRSGKTLEERLARELVNIARNAEMKVEKDADEETDDGEKKKSGGDGNAGGVFAKKKEVHELAVANRSAIGTRV
ncbi:ribosomal protein S7 [Sistotremastrum suecicum HHB10207 ss-3]|uniref:Ribosomal protein S7 n=1 Tax=Sistotremastrum suecicum HHB10207 ss-3 TaxID=1314776 RepID=A0A166DHE0_9AGAM|nr:ribosomal protein S7 [Sistotremastrum suecicum HHB10207 ss-3]